jgi:hypothetical protein
MRRDQVEHLRVGTSEPVVAGRRDHDLVVLSLQR